ncbi:MAG TPA: hypothetical protein VNG91_08400, partial [Terriglobia bacterium]|nr:hypothetical protein [Terriglobia bacterium]
ILLRLLLSLLGLLLRSLRLLLSLLSLLLELGLGLFSLIPLAGSLQRALFGMGGSIDRRSRLRRNVSHLPVILLNLPAEMVDFPVNSVQARQHEVGKNHHHKKSKAGEQQDPGFRQPAISAFAFRGGSGILI